MKITGRLLISLFILLMHQRASAQKDSLILKNRDIIVGEIKLLSKSVLNIETGYSDNDFTIEWSGVKEIYTKGQFIITLSSGLRTSGIIRSVPGSDNVVITDADKNTIQVKLDEIVFIKELESSFWSRAKAAIDVGFTITKENNLRQLSVRSNLGYVAEKWQLDGYFNILKTKQDSIEPTDRVEGGITYKYLMQKNWFLETSISFLSNTEQALKLRTTGKMGGGKMLVYSNKAYWGLGAGLSFNNESFTNETNARNSLEGYMGSQLNIYDTKDFSILSTLSVYRSFTESGRWRADFQLDAKYDLPHDFYIKPGITYNFDNRPAAIGKETDYVFVFTIGWEL